MANIINIEWTQPTREFQCPVCQASALNANGKLASQPCSHFLFNWDSDREDFVDVTDEIETALDDAALDIDGPLTQALMDSIPSSAVVYQITVRDEALGPVRKTDVIAFDPLAS